MGIGVAVRIYHNPKCATSRKVLEMLRSKGVEPDIVDYLKEPPPEEEWRDVLSKLSTPPESMLRKREPLYTTLGLAGKRLSAERVARLLAVHPRLLERPVLVGGGRAVVARPPERARELLG